MVSLFGEDIQKEKNKRNCFGHVVACLVKVGGAEEESCPAVCAHTLDSVVEVK